jgi:tetratricopeptide (TPR) repeat protein
MKKVYLHLPSILVLACCVFLGAGCSKSARAKRLISSADQDYKALQYDSAETKYRGVLRLSYMNPVAIRQLGLIYYAEGRPTDAYAYLKKSLELQPGNSEVQLRLAQTIAGLGGPKDAAALASKVLQKTPGNEDALLLLVDVAHDVTNLAAVRREIETLPAEGADAAAHASSLAWVDLRLLKTNQAKAEAEQALGFNPKLVSANMAMFGVSILSKDTNAASNYIAAAASASPLRSATRIKFADYLYQSGSQPEAERMLEDIMRQAPDYVPASINLMQVYFAEHQYDKCSDVVSRILARDPHNYDALMEAGNIAMARQDAAGAVEAFKRLDAVHKNVPAAKYRLATAYLMHGETANAVGALNEILVKTTNFPPAILLLADLDIRGGSSSAAINLLTPLVKRNPQEARAHLLLALAYIALHQPDDALAIYRGMAKTFPKNPEVFRLIGVVYQMEGKGVEARQAFEQSLALVPDYFPTLERLTHLDLKERRFTDAEQRLAGVISKNPNHAQPYLLQGQVDLESGKTNEAESALSKAIELDPASPGPYLSLAKLYMKSHQTPQALARLNALMTKTNNAQALLLIGELHQQADEFDQARDAYEKLLEFQPKFVPALNNLAYLYSEHYGNLKKAAEVAARARDAQPDNPYVADTFGWILYKQGEYSRAVNLLQESLEKQPNSAEIHMHLGMVYYMLEEEEVARVNLQEALSSPEDYPGKEQARLCFSLLSIDPATATPAQIDSLQKRLQDAPNDPIPLNRLAAIAELHGDNDKAVEYYKKLIDGNPKDWKAMLKLAQVYSSKLHDTRKALDLAKSAHELAPNDPRAAATLGELVYTSGDYSWALNLLQESVPQLPNEPSAHYYLALADYSAGRLRDADAAMNEAVKAGASLPTLDQANQFLAYRAAANDPAHSEVSMAQAKTALEKDPHFLPAEMLCGLLAEQQGDYKQASQTYEQILSDYPKFTPAMRQLALIYTSHSGDVSKAYDLAEKARAAYPDDLLVTKTLGILAYRKADYERSTQLLREVARKNDTDGELLYYLGMDYYQLKQPTKSKQSLQRALALNVPDPMAAEAHKTLAQLK